MSFVIHRGSGGRTGFVVDAAACWLDFLDLCLGFSVSEEVEEDRLRFLWCLCLSFFFFFVFFVLFDVFGGRTLFLWIVIIFELFEVSKGHHNTFVTWKYYNGIDALFNVNGSS